MMFRFIITCLCFIIIPVQAMACSCASDSFTDEGSRKNINKAEFIFEGAALNIKDAVGAPYFSEVSFRIDKLYKGDNPNQSIMAYVDTKTTCGLAPLHLKKQRFFMMYTLKGQYVLAGHCGSYISDADMKALKRGDFKKTQPQKIEFPETFRNFEALEKWAKTSTIGGGDIEKILFKKMTLTKVLRMHTSGIVTSDLSLYSPLKTGEYKLVASYPYVVYDSILTQQTPEILSFITNNGGETLLELASADILGKSCAQKSDCEERQYCFKNDYFVAKGLCWPCPDIKDEHMPADCK